jgi:hypothetical protein
VRLTFAGLGVSPSTVMACAVPNDHGADEFGRAVGEELGRDGWFRDAVLPNGRDPIWYFSLVHYAAPVTAAEPLLEWVDARRDVGLGSQVYDAVSRCVWAFDGHATRPRALATSSAA